MNTTSDTPNSCHPQWGAYAPSPKSRLLRLLITLGLGRSTIRKKILITWRKKYGHIVDVEVRGIKYRLNISDNVTDGKILVSSKIYDKVEIEYLSASSRENNFIDIGANIGYYSLAIAHKGAKRVLAIEPNPPTLGGASLIKLQDTASAVTITTKPLWDILQANNITTIGGLKIDIEGREDLALGDFFNTAPKTAWPKCMVVEHCHRQLWETDILAFLVQLGYKIIIKIRGNNTILLWDKL